MLKAERFEIARIYVPAKHRGRVNPDVAREKPRGFGNGPNACHLARLLTGPAQINSRRWRRADPFWRESTFGS